MANLPKNPALIKLDDIAAPLYHAMGQTLTRWQFTETGMFLLAHAIMGADYKYSSTAFFRLKGADAKLQFLDELCEIHFAEAVIQAEWRPLRKQLRESINFRNCLAHFEINYVRSRKYIPKGDPPVILSPHHLDTRASGKPEVRAVNLTELTQMGENYRALTNSLISLVRRHFSLEKLLATHLPPHWQQFLATGQTPLQAQPPPPEIIASVGSAQGISSAICFVPMAHQKCPSQWGFSTSYYPWRSVESSP